MKKLLALFLSIISQSLSTGKYVCAIYYSDGIESALITGIQFLEDNYTTNNAITTLIIECFDDFSSQDKLAVIGALEQLKSNYEGESLERIETDIEILS